jgi:hypothetical protein
MLLAASSERFFPRGLSDSSAGMFDGESGLFVDIVLEFLGRITPVGRFAPAFVFV